jgi:hypothetical protein
MVSSNASRYKESTLHVFLLSGKIYRGHVHDRSATYVEVVADGSDLTQLNCGFLEVLNSRLQLRWHLRILQSRKVGLRRHALENA